MNTGLRPRVSIIIHSDDRAEMLGQMIDSVMMQTFSSWELWVIGNACKDISEDVVNAFGDPRILWFNLPVKADSHEKLIFEGIRRSRGEYIAYLEVEHLWFSNHLELLVEKLDSTGADLACSMLHCVHSHDYSTLNIPILPEFPNLPDCTSVVHKKNEFTFLVADPELTYPEKILQLARTENLKIEVVPVTTGLKFLWNNDNNAVVSQKVYVERLRKDPDFINKELSAILFRTEQHLQTPGGKHAWLHWLGKPLQNMMQRLTGLRRIAKIKVLKTDQSQFSVRPANALKRSNVN